MFRTALLAAVVPLALGSEYSYTYDYTDAPSAAPTIPSAVSDCAADDIGRPDENGDVRPDAHGLRGRVVRGGGKGD